MKAEQREFIDIMDSFRKLNIACMLPAEISHGEFSLLKMIQRRVESEDASGEKEDTGVCSDKTERNGRGVKVSWLVKKARVPAPAISRTLRTLEQKGFIERTVDKDDRRNTFVSLTEAGTAINREIDGIMEGFADAVFGNMGEETMQRMNGYLKQFLETSRNEIEKRRYTDKKTDKTINDKTDKGERL